MTSSRLARVLLFASGSLLLLDAGCDQTDSSVSDAAAPPAALIAESTAGDPELTFVSLEHDLGEMWNIETDRKGHGFEFTNTGDSLLVISDIKPSCGCTTADLEKREYLPGEGSVIEVTFDPKNRQGRQTKTISIVTNAERQGPVQLRISADIKPFVAFEPPSVRFDEARLGEAHTTIVELSSPDPALVIESITCSGSHLEARLLERVVELGPRREGEEPAPHRIEITLAEETPWGEASRTVTVNCRGRLDEGGEEIAHTAHLSVKANVFGELQADPPSFRFGSVQPGEPIEKRVRLTRIPAAPFTILDLRLERPSQPDLQVRAEPIDEEGVAGYEVILSGTSNAEASRSISGTVVIETNVEGEERLELWCFGVVRAAVN